MIAKSETVKHMLLMIIYSLTGYLLCTVVKAIYSKCTQHKVDMTILVVQRRRKDSTEAGPNYGQDRWKTRNLGQSPT